MFDKTKRAETWREKRETAWVEYEEHGMRLRIRASFGLEKLAGNEHAYFAITGETQRRENGRWQEDSWGCQHKLIAEHFPQLRPMIPWHLTDATGAPMHYAANARYWLEVANFAKNARETPDKAREYFKHAVIWGVLPEDETGTIPDLREADAWLAARLPKLRETFRCAMQRWDLHKRLPPAAGEI